MDEVKKEIEEANTKGDNDAVVGISPLEENPNDKSKVLDSILKSRFTCRSI